MNNRTKESKCINAKYSKKYYYNLTENSFLRRVANSWPTSAITLKVNGSPTEIDIFLKESWPTSAITLSYNTQRKRYSN